MEQTEKTQKKFLTIPNIMSLLRLALIPVIIYLYCVKEEPLLTALALILSGVTDVVDGFIARHFNMVSEIGKALDPIADKLTQGAMLLCLVTRFPLMLASFIFLLAKELFTGAMGLVILRKTGKVYGAVWHGKVTTILLYSMMILHTVWFNIPSLISNISIGICAAMMLISLVLYNLRYIKILKQHKKESEENTERV